MNSDDRTRYINAVTDQEWKTAWWQVEPECQAILSNMAERGILHSTMTVSRLQQAHFKAAERVLARRLQAEEEVLAEEGAGAPENWWVALEQDVQGLLTSLGRETKDRLQAHIERLLPGEKSWQIETNLGRLRDHFLLGVEAVRGKHGLRVRARAREAGAAMAKVTVTISNSTVGALNLGTVIGDIEANLTSLRTGGQEQFADALKCLTESIGNEEALGNRRKEALEQVAALSDEAERPPEQRRLGIVKAVVDALPTALAISANLLKVWEVAFPQIRIFFGLP